jgi:hypothetical protein
MLKCDNIRLLITITIDYINKQHQVITIDFRIQRPGSHSGEKRSQDDEKVV